MSAFTTDPFHTSNCRCCEAHARTLTDLAALVELGKERDYAMEMVNVQDNQIDALRALLRQVHSVMNDIPAPPYPWQEIEDMLAGKDAT